MVLSAQRAFSYDCEITYIINQKTLLEYARRAWSCVGAKINLIYWVNILYMLCQECVHFSAFFLSFFSLLNAERLTAELLINMDETL